MKVLSLFDGISCCRVALDRAGIPVTEYYASEIDKYAISVAKKNYPDTLHLGDIRNIKAKVLYLSEVYPYLCKYDINIQSKISEQEVLYWVNEEFTLSANFRTQIQNERQEVPKSSAIQCFEEIRITKCGMGDIIKARNIGGSGDRRDKTYSGNPINIQCSEWRYGYDLQRGNKEENFKGVDGETKNRNLQTKNIRNLKEKIPRQKGTRTYFQENKESYVDRKSEKKLFRRSEKDRYVGEIGKEESNIRDQANRIIDRLSHKLQTWNDTNRTSKSYGDFLFLHSSEQVTVVEYDGGVKIFKGCFDILCAGSPCQGFSFAGKQLNFEDPRSKLFFEYVRILKEVKPKYFLLENVKMKKEFQDVISEQLGVEPVEINSSLVSAQSRKRLYWANFPITQPEDKGIFLKDIVHENSFVDREKSHAIISSIARTTKREYFKKNQGQMAFDWLAEYIVPLDKSFKLLDKEVERGKVGYFKKDSQANRVYFIHDKAVTLCGEAGGGAAKMGQYLFGCITPDRVNKRQNGQRFSVGDKFYTLTAQDRHGILTEGYIRKLTPVECERLQTLEDGWTECSGVSQTQRYKMLGNAWTCDVVAHILRGIK